MNTIARRHIGTQPARRPGPAMPPNYHPPRWLPSGRLQTCRGVVIGGAIPPPLPAVTQDGTRIQAAPLDPRTARPRRRIAPVAITAGLWIFAIGACAAAVWLQITF